MNRFHGAIKKEDNIQEDQEERSKEQERKQKEGGKEGMRMKTWTDLQ